MCEARDERRLAHLFVSRRLTIVSLFSFMVNRPEKRGSARHLAHCMHVSRSTRAARRHPHPSGSGDASLFGGNGSCSRASLALPLRCLIGRQRQRERAKEGDEGTLTLVRDSSRCSRRHTHAHQTQTTWYKGFTFHSARKERQIQVFVCKKIRSQVVFWFFFLRKKAFPFADPLLPCFPFPLAAPDAASFPPSRLLS